MKQLPDNAKEVMVRRYALRNEAGKTVETPEDILKRAARVVAQAENNYRDGVTPQAVERKFGELLTDFRFVPNGRTLANAGTAQGQLANCFVLPLEDEMGKTEEGIFSILRKAVLILQAGGGVGFSFGRIRPKGDIAGRGKATGAVSFLKIFDTAFWIIGQGGGRRSACMAVLPVSHPDIYDFIHCKEQEGVIEHFNISVGVTDEFMKAVEQDKDFNLVNPRNNQRWRTVRARDLFQEIVTFAHHNGEPGVLFLDAANRDNPVPNQYNLEATNPCFNGATRMPTQFGLLKIEELVRLGLAIQTSVDNRSVDKIHKGIKTVAASTAFMTGKQKPVYLLITKHGYQIKTTSNHRFLTEEGEYKELKRLMVGDRICLQSGEGIWSSEYELPNSQLFQFNQQAMTMNGSVAMTMANRYRSIPNQWSKELGVVMGWLIGDGWLTQKSNSSLGFAFGKSQQGITGLTLIHSWMKNWFTKGTLSERSRGWQLTYGKTPSEFFRTLGVLNTKATEKIVPESIFSAPRDVVIGFLQGLFSSDGTVQISPEKQYCSVRLASSSRKLLSGVQLLLLNFGIISTVLKRRSAGKRQLPNARGKLATYKTHDQYELIIGKDNRKRFGETIGFALKDKQDKLEQFQLQMRKGPYAEKYIDEVVTIKYAGKADVYDLTEATTHSLIGNGFVTHNCGEQFLGPFENCCMASINLAEHTRLPNTENQNPSNKLFKVEVDWEKLKETVEYTVRWLDDVVDANDYVPAVPQLQEAAHKNRRIGVSIMGLADLMYQVGVRYGSEKAIDLSGQIMEFIRFYAMKMSIRLAQERGPFPGIVGSIYDYSHIPQTTSHKRWQPPKPIKPYKHQFGRIEIGWQELLKDLQKYGIRNSCQTTIQPTGAIATIAGLEGYGCEPVFALSYVMKTHEGAEEKGNGTWAELYYESKLFKQALERSGMNTKEQEIIFQAVRANGSCQGIELVPKAIQEVFVVSADATVEEHVLMQASLQAFVDNAISKTINFPEEATEADVYSAYVKGFKLGLKGMTVYVTGSRKTVVLETQATNNKHHEINQDQKLLQMQELFTNNGNGIIGKPLHKVRPQDLTCAECGAIMVLQEGCATCPTCGSTHCSV